tara:strand:- start:15329 stop:15793 length:465 start_codon:yes stop_codon:yes gene_type:complete
MSDKKREFRKLQREWYKRLEASGFDDIERSGKNRTKYYDEYSGILKRPQSVLRNKYNLFTYKYYDIASYLGYNAIFLPKIDLKVLELHGKGYTIQRISNHLREHFEYPLNKLGRSGKPYSVFFVHTKLKYLKLLILVYAQSDCMESVKKSWQSL